MIEAEELEDLSRELRELNDKAPIYPTSYCDLNYSLLFSRIDTEKLLDEMESCNTPENRPGNLSLPGRVADLKRTVDFFEKHRDRLYRVKGFIKVKGEVYFISDGDSKISAVPWRGSEHKETAVTILCPKEEEIFFSEHWEEIQA